MIIFMTEREGKLFRNCYEFGPVFPVEYTEFNFGKEILVSTGFSEEIAEIYDISFMPGPFLTH